LIALFDRISICCECSLVLSNVLCCGQFLRPGRQTSANILCRRFSSKCAWCTQFPTVFEIDTNGRFSEDNSHRLGMR
jgi:hypothetical protein